MSERKVENTRQLVLIAQIKRGFLVFVLDNVCLSPVQTQTKSTCVCCRRLSIKNQSQHTNHQSPTLSSKSINQLSTLKSHRKKHKQKGQNGKEE